MTFREGEIRAAPSRECSRMEIRMKKVSVVVPCFNAASYLHHCMDHLITQTIGMENIEIILVDDASTDNGATWDVIMQYESRYPDSIIAVRLEENLRQGGARNVGISYASGEYLLFCDSDDWLRVEALELLYNVITHENADVVGFRIEEVRTYGEEGDLIKVGDGSYEIVMENDERRRSKIFASEPEFSLGAMDKFYRLSLINEQKIRFAEHLICEEPSFVMPVRLYMTKYVFVDAALYYYVENQSGTMKGSWNGRQLDNTNVWVGLLEDLKARGFADRFPLELEYMFWSWGIELTVEMATIKKILMGVPEWTFLKEKAMEYCPDIRNNPYLGCYDIKRTEILIKLMDMELTEDNISELYRCLIQYLKRP